MSRFVIAGATGRVGSVVAGELLARGERVAVITRDAARGAAWAALGAEIAVGSLNDEAFVARTLRDATGFFALLPEDVDPFAFHASRRRMADAIAAGVTRSEVPHVVMLSSVGAHLASGNGPAAGLHYLEEALRSATRVFTAVRAMTFQDNVAGLIPVAREMGIYPVLIGAPDTPVPMVATRDVGAVVAHELAAPAPRNDVVDVMGPLCTATEIADLLATALGRQVQVVPVPRAAHVSTLVQSGMPEPLAAIVAELFSAVADGRFVPKGDRRVVAETRVSDILPSLLGAAMAAR